MAFPAYLYYTGTIPYYLLMTDRIITFVSFTYLNKLYAKKFKQISAQRSLLKADFITRADFPEGELLVPACQTPDGHQITGRIKQILLPSNVCSPDLIALPKGDGKSGIKFTQFAQMD